MCCQETLTLSFVENLGFDLSEGQAAEGERQVRLSSKYGKASFQEQAKTHSFKNQTLVKIEIPAFTFCIIHADKMLHNLMFVPSRFFNFNLRI